MAARAVLQDQPRGGVQQQKNGERKNRTALGDIGNLVTVRGAVAANGIVKPNQINRPRTRSFCAQLLANAQAASDKNKKEGEQLVNVNAGVKRVAQKKIQEKKKVEVIVIDTPSSTSDNGKSEGKQGLNKEKSPTLTSFLTAHSKEACGLSNIVNIDEKSIEDELAVVEYVEDIYNFYKVAEDESRVYDYMGKQSDINEKMRSILVDWLIEVHHKFQLRQETLYLTINIIDRFLSTKIIPRKELQLVGISSMLIACKYEEIWAPEVSDFVQISDKAYLREQVLAMEKTILGKLEWYLTVPTPYMFLTRYIKASLPDSEMENMVYFFSELGIMNYATTIRYPPSMLAASSVYVARCTLNKSPSWTDTLEHYTAYSEEQLKECSKMLASFHLGAPENRLRAVYKKFSKPEMGSVALRTPAKTLLASTS